MTNKNEEQSITRDVELLRDYLVKDLIEKKKIPHNKAQAKVKEFLFENKDKLFTYHGIAWELGRTNLEFFCMYFLQDIFIGSDKAELSQTHISIWRELEDMILRRDYNQRNYICPRGFGKTTCISTPIAIWSHVYGYKKYTVIASAIGDTAEEFLKNIRNAIEDNKRIEKAFGKLIDRKKFICNSEKIEFTNRTMIQSISASGAIRGKNYNSTRIELLILDDYQKSDEVATDEQREKKWKIFNEDAKNAMQKSNSTMLSVGTVQHKECFYSRLMNSKTWKTRIEKGVLVDDVDTYFHSGKWEEFYQLLINKNDDNSFDTAKEFYFQNQDDMQFPMLWSEYWNCLDYAISYYENRQAFMQEIQNDVNSIGEKKFKTIITEDEETINSHTFVKTCLSVDPAGTSRKGKKKDFYAFSVGSMGADNNIIYIRKGEIHDFEYNDYLNKVIELLKKYPDISAISIEKNVYMGADVVKLEELISKDIELASRDIEIINQHRTGNKDDRIDIIVGDTNMGRIRFNEEDTEALEQLHDFAGCHFSAFDDFPDVVADVVQRLHEIETFRYIKVFDRKLLGI